MVHSLVVIKEARDDPIPDKPISFPKFDNLHLELMENKRKMKKNLPPIKIQPIKIAPPPPPPKPPTPVNKEEDSEIEIEIGTDEEGNEEKPPKKTKPKVVKPLGETQRVGDTQRVGEKDEDDDLINELGDGNEDDNNETEEPLPQPEDPYANLSPEERERQEKEEYLWRYRILKRQYPKRSIPEYNEHDDFYTMKTNYDRIVKEIHLEVNVDNYRMYLMGGFMAVEFLCTNLLGVDMKGFAAQQQAAMDKYERFLIEIGERSYNSWGANLPVEVRLLGFIVMQAGIFYIGKWMMSSGGVNMATIFGAMTGNTSAQKPVEGPKMKGPSIKVEDIRKASDSVPTTSSTKSENKT